MESRSSFFLSDFQYENDNFPPLCHLDWHSLAAGFVDHNLKNNYYCIIVNTNFEAMQCKVTVVEPLNGVQKSYSNAEVTLWSNSLCFLAVLRSNSRGSQLFSRMWDTPKKTAWESHGNNGKVTWWEPGLWSWRDGKLEGWPESTKTSRGSQGGSGW